MKQLTSYKRLGIQKRIMLYVAVGLTLMFGIFALVGLELVQRATELVYEERLNTAYTTAGVLNKDFFHVTREVKEESSSLLSGDEQRLKTAIQALLKHLSETDPFPFFRVTGVSVLNNDGRLLAETGKPEMTAESLAPVLSWVTDASGEEYGIVSMGSGGIEGVPHATIITRRAGNYGSPDLAIGVHTLSLNSADFYIPTSYGQSSSGQASTPSQDETRQGSYHLEIMDPDGIIVLGIGEDEHPGEVSLHFATIQDIMAERKATTLLHKPAPGETFKSHVMAIVPLISSNFYVIFEQPTDVVLALPSEMRLRITLIASIGFLATLLVTWITTRHVVKPTEQLTSAALRIASGDLESPISIRAQDEVGDLAESLDTMRRKMLAAYQEIEIVNKGLESQVRERTARLEEVLRKIISAQEEERYRLARELHDETAQTIGALSISLDRARDGLEEDDDTDALKHLLEAKTIATRLLEETRRLILDLRPQALDDLGLGPAIRWYAETHLEELGVAVTVEIEPVNRMPEHIEVSLFRVIQEAINNIGKHANAKHAHIRLARQDSKVSVMISDDGKGFNADRVMESSVHGNNVGLLGMQERVRLLNGSIQIHSQEGAGTEISIDIPILEEPV